MSLLVDGRKRGDEEAARKARISSNVHLGYVDVKIPGPIGKRIPRLLQVFARRAPRSVELEHPFT